MMQKLQGARVREGLTHDLQRPQDSRELRGLTGTFTRLLTAAGAWGMGVGDLLWFPVLISELSLKMKYIKNIKSLFEHKSIPFKQHQTGSGLKRSTHRTSGGDSYREAMDTHLANYGLATAESLVACL